MTTLIMAVKETTNNVAWVLFRDSICTICGLSLLVLFSVLRGFLLGSLVFPSPQTPAFD